jgi:hypothetical protein
LRSRRPSSCGTAAQAATRGRVSNQHTSQNRQHRAGEQGPRRAKEAARAGPTLMAQKRASAAQRGGIAAEMQRGEHAGQRHAPVPDLGRVDRGRGRRLGALRCASGCVCRSCPCRGVARRLASQRARAAPCARPCARADAPCAPASLPSQSEPFC